MNYSEILQDALPGKYNDAFFSINFRFEAAEYSIFLSFYGVGDVEACLEWLMRHKSVKIQSESYNNLELM